jgi:hypothetical protein
MFVVYTFLHHEKASPKQCSIKRIILWWQQEANESWGLVILSISLFPTIVFVRILNMASSSSYLVTYANYLQMFGIGTACHPTTQHDTL